MKKILTFDGDAEGTACLLFRDGMPRVESNLVQALLKVGFEPRAPGRLRPYVPKPIEVRGGLIERNERLVATRRQFRDYVFRTVQSRLAVF